MNIFEDDLCSTVDEILHILGHKPKMTREALDNLTSQPSKGDKSVRSKGARLVRSPSELDRALQNM